MELIISEQNGWKKPIRIEKAITRLGSAPASDIQLNGPHIAPVHLQVYYLADSPMNSRVFNLGSAVNIRVGDRHHTLSTLETFHIKNGSELELGDYRIQFRLPLSTTTLQKTTSLQASLRFPEPTLLPNQSATAWLTIKNTGVQGSCQVDIGLSGLPEDCMQVDPAPLLYAGGQEDVRIQLFHRQLYPAAGFQDLTIMVSACDSYPGEEVVINQGIYVTPVFEQSLQIVDDLANDDSSRKLQATASILADRPVRSIPQTIGGNTPVNDPASNPALPVNADDLVPEIATQKQDQAEVAQMAEVSAGLSGLDQLKLKVVRNPSDDFWEKE
jgi:predicted component of type VI protein secretion system